MATYVVGDVQGCFDPLMQLVKTISFDPSRDKIIFCGDLVNRGGQSLDVLRWIYAYQHCCDAVLGNHDLSMLSKYFTAKKVSNAEFKAIFQASDVTLLISWLLNRPLYLESGNDMIVHAGLFPWWTVEQFKELADKTQQHLLENPKWFFATMYGNTPKRWSEDLDKVAKSRFVINASTRMRFVKADGSLNFTQNRRQSKMKYLKPWFEMAPVKQLKQHIIFGHWSALGFYQDQRVTCLDTGKVWGGQLTAMRLEDRQLFSI